MEFTENHRFPKRFMHSVVACGLAAEILSLFLFPHGQLGVPFLLLSIVAVHTNSRCALLTPRDRWQLFATDAFVFLAMLLFDGEAAILLATVTALCLSLPSSKKRLNLLFNSAVTVIAALLVAWTLQFNFGSISALDASKDLSAILKAVGFAILLQSVFKATVATIGEAYKIKQSVCLTWARYFLRTSLTAAAGVVAAGLLAKAAVMAGLYNSIAAMTIIAIADFAYRSYQGNADLRGLPTEQKATTKENPERFRSAFDYAAIGMAIVSSEGRWLQVNRSLCSLLGYSEQELLTTDFLKVTHPDDIAASLEHIKQLLRGKIPTCQMEKRYLHKRGHEVWVLWSVSLSRDMNTQSVHLIFQIQDITNRKLAEQQLQHDAFHDALTGLPNRALFMDHLRLAIARAQRNPGQSYAVIYLDLDRFKIINDSLGHMIGDQLLVGMARRLESCLRPVDTIARLGGDEFTVLIEDIKDDRGAIEAAERIQKELGMPFNLCGREVVSTVSIGIAIGASEYERAEDVLRDADTAMYRAKSLGKARYAIFDKAMHDRAMKTLQLETDLRQAVDRQEFSIHYQPIVVLETGRLCGFEALVRWRHPERGLISPGDFIPVAEETGLIIQIGEWVLREACRQMQQWQMKFHFDQPLMMSVNLSGKQFTQPDLINEVTWILRETKLQPQCLKLEITESVVMENIGTATEMLNQLRALGARLSIDDFGTGYSSLSYLHRFPIDTLKIDRSFVTRMIENTENAEIVRTIVVLAQNLGMDVIAEGVETKEQLMMLRELNCENGQGYLFSKPVDAKGAEKIISDAIALPASILNHDSSKSAVGAMMVA